MDAPAALLAGFLSGGAIAMQFGAVSALLLETAITAGPRVGVSAGLGVATVDVAYAAVAVVAGAAAHAALASHEAQLRAIAAATLALIAARGLRGVVRDLSPSRPARPPVVGAARRYGSALAQYLRFLALTAINPLTIVYFASVAASVSLPGPSARVAFVIGAGAASAIWHAFLTLAAGHAGRRLTPATQRAVTIVGRLIVVGAAVRFALAI
jgi:threonine/homoserine/homoserine lactone efflux protein